MSDRLTNKWTNTAEQAFGATGAKGLLGEQFMMKVFESWGWECRHFENDRRKQLQGIDIEFKKPVWKHWYSCDVKNNMSNDGTFFVHEDWLFKVTCNRIFHVNPETGWMAWYPVKEMRDFFRNNHYTRISKKGIHYLIIFGNETPEFVTRRKYEPND